MPAVGLVAFHGHFEVIDLLEGDELPRANSHPEVALLPGGRTLARIHHNVGTDD
ncbi:MAG: hypothetical protein IPN07_02155 [Dehalococcoidia bacterium]|nr:hypothetical protein [Dehalococcoidia bacterium]